jgi:alanyl-tRNA synthetase
MIDLAKEKIKSGILFFTSTYQGKAFMVCWVSDDWVKKGLSASTIIKEVSPIAGGSGGGKPNLSQAGSNNPEKLTEALTELPKVLKRMSLK